MLQILIARNLIHKLCILADEGVLLVLLCRSSLSTARRSYLNTPRNICCSSVASIWQPWILQPWGKSARKHEDDHEQAWPIAYGIQTKSKSWPAENIEVVSVSRWSLMMFRGSSIRACYTEIRGKCATYTCIKILSVIHIVQQPPEICWWV